MIRDMWFKISQIWRVVSESDCQLGCLRFKCWHPASAETCMWGRWLAVMPVIYTGKCVTSEVNIWYYASAKVRIRLPILALKPRGDVTRSPKQEYQWSQKWKCVQQKFLKKDKPNMSVDGYVNLAFSVIYETSKGVTEFILNLQITRLVKSWSGIPLHTLAVLSRCISDH